MRVVFKNSSVIMCASAAIALAGCGGSMTTFGSNEKNLKAKPAPDGGNGESKPPVLPTAPLVQTPNGPPTAPCKVDILEIFEGFAVKGGSKESVPSQVDAYPGSTFELKFTEGSKLSYANGELAASKGILAVKTEAVVVSIKDVPECQADVTVRLLPDDSFVVSEQLKRGIKGKLYKLAPNAKRLPDFSTLDPEGLVYMTSFAVAPRNFADGFPGVSDDLQEYFALDFTGFLVVEKPGLYEFKVNSDDGSKLYLKDVLVVDNDFTHGPLEKSGSASLKEGLVPIRLSYFQGPRELIALELRYKGPGMSKFEYVPQSLLRVEAPPK